LRTPPTSNVGEGRVPNDAHLVQLVRGALGRDPKTRHLRPRPNVSSCGFVVTLHGCVPAGADARALVEVVRGVPGVEGVEGKLFVS
jgi:osmotically-inducible protein OsmY